jgi:hypothetical protein
MEHGHAIIETWVALMPQCLMIMHDDVHDQDFNCFLTSRMLQLLAITSKNSWTTYYLISDILF